MIFFRYIYYRLCIYYKELDDSKFRWNVLYMLGLYGAILTGCILCLFDISFGRFFNTDIRDSQVLLKILGFSIAILNTFVLYILLTRKPFEDYVDKFSNCTKYNRINVEWIRAAPIVFGIIIMSLLLTLNSLLGKYFFT